MLVGTDVCVRVVFVWGKAEYPEETQHVWLDDHMTTDTGKDAF